MKLTLPQYRLLVSLLSGPALRYQTHKPAIALVNHGLACWRKRPGNPLYTKWELHITKAGYERI